MNYAWHDVLGNLGVVLILLTYGLLQLQRIDPLGWRYSAGNGLGALWILISLFYDFNLSAVLLESAWLAISGFGLWQFWRRRQREAQEI